MNADLKDQEDDIEKEGKSVNALKFKIFSYLMRYEHT